MDEYYGWNRCWGILGISANQESRVVARGERAEQRPEEQSGSPGQSSGQKSRAGNPGQSSSPVAAEQ